MAAQPSKLFRRSSSLPFTALHKNHKFSKDLFPSVSGASRMGKEEVDNERRREKQKRVSTKCKEPKQYESRLAKDFALEL